MHHRSEPKALTISIDYDRTFTAAPGLWRSFIHDATNRGNRVVCISRRDDSDENREELRIAFGDLDVAQLVLCGASKQKRTAAAELGINVDVWIDDYPEGIVDQKPADQPPPHDGARSFVRVSSLSGIRAAAAAAAARLEIAAGGAS